MNNQFTRIILHIEDPEMSYLKLIAHQEGRNLRDHVMYLIRSDLLKRTNQATDNQAQPEQKKTPA